jgi:HEAT repeat protein
MRRHYLIILVLLFVGGVIGFIMASQGEPTFEGKRLSSWLRDLRDPSALVQHRAQIAVRHMGTNAVPVLQEMLHAQDSPLRTNIVNLLQRQTLFKLSFAPARERRMRAALACAILGPMASPAVPDLLEFSIGDSFCSNLAESALGCMGEAAVPPLCLTLMDTNSNYTLRRVSVGALASIGPPARAAIPALTNSLKDNFSEIRATAAHALGRIGVPSPEVVRALVELFDDQDFKVRICAEIAVTGFGKPAVPTLASLSKDPDVSIWRGATKALDEITTADKNQSGESPQP